MLLGGPYVLSLMYHRVNEPKTPRIQEAFYRHLTYLKANYPIVLPGEPLRAPLSICLTFDDAYVDFFDTVYPFLKAHNIRAILGVPTAYIQEDTSLPLAERLAVPYPQGMQAPVYQEKVPLCTWKELHTMASSGCVVMASHTHSHPHLSKEGVDVKKELVYSKQLLEERLETKVENLIYPYGNFNSRVHQKAQEEYPYIHRIGGAANKVWGHPRSLLYRVDAEPWWYDKTHFNQQDLWRWIGRYAWNRIRGK